MLRRAGAERGLEPEEYRTLLQLCGARRRHSSEQPCDDALASLLIAEHFVVETPQRPNAWIVPDQQVKLAAGVELWPAVFEVLDARNQAVGFVGAVGATVLDACDGRRTATDLALPPGIDLTEELSHLQTNGLVEVIPPAMALRRNVMVRRPADAVIAVPRTGSFKYLLCGDEADVLARCDAAGSVRALLDTAAGGDEPWLLALLARASVWGLVTMSNARPSARPGAITPPPSAVVRPPVLPAPGPPIAELDELDSAPTAVELAGSPMLDGLDDPVVPPHRSTPLPSERMIPVPQVPAVSNGAAKLQTLTSLSLDKGPPPSAAPRGSRLPWILLALVVGGVGYHYVRAGHSEASPAAGSAAPAAKTDVAPSSGGAVLATGYIDAKDPIVLSATVSGKLVAINVDDGDAIKKGEVLALVDDRELRAQLGLANARIRDAQRSLQRTRMLMRAEGATAGELDRAVGQVEITSAEAAVIKQQIEDTKIVSPIDGTVLEVIAHIGETVNAGPNQGVVVKVADLRALIAEVDVDEAELKNVFMHQSADVIADAQRGQIYKGTVSEIAEQADRARGTVPVKVDIVVPPDSVLKPGMAVQVSFKPKS